MLALKVVRALAAPLVQAFGTTADDPYTLTVDDTLSTLARLCLQRYVYDTLEVVRLPQLDERQKAIFAALAIRPPTTRSLST
jgi:hypothetical protein